MGHTNGPAHAKLANSFLKNLLYLKKYAQILLILDSAKVMKTSIGNQIFYSQAGGRSLWWP